MASEYEGLIQKGREVRNKQISMVFVEGMFIFKNEKLRNLFDFKIFVEVDEDIRLSRMGKHNINFSFT
jgi:dephospho-CoA kinase